MIGLTDGEKRRAVAGGQSAFGIALAELSMYWDQHPQGRPEATRPRVMNFRIPDEGTPEERIAEVEAFARWLGVPVTRANGCVSAMRRFGMGDQCLIVEAHFTPDPARAVMERQDAKKAAEKQQDAPEDARPLAAVA